MMGNITFVNTGLSSGVMKMEAVCTSKIRTSTYKFTWCYNPDDPSTTSSLPQSTSNLKTCIVCNTKERAEWK